MVVPVSVREIVKGVDELAFGIAVGIFDGNTILLPLLILVMAPLEVFDYAIGSFGQLLGKIVVVVITHVVGVSDMFHLRAVFTMVEQLGNAVYCLAGDSMRGSRLLSGTLLFGRLLVCGI